MKKRGRGCFQFALAILCVCACCFVLLVRPLIAASAIGLFLCSSLFSPPPWKHSNDPFFPCRLGAILSESSLYIDHQTSMSFVRAMLLVWMAGPGTLPNKQSIVQHVGPYAANLCWDWSLSVIHSGCMRMALTLLYSCYIASNVYWCWSYEKVASKWSHMVPSFFPLPTSKREPNISPLIFSSVLWLLALHIEAHDIASARLFRDQTF